MPIGHLTTALKRAAYHSIPNHKTSKEIKSGLKRIWNTEISKALKCCKDIWCQWPLNGEPSDNKNLLVVQKKQEKLNLRKAQRQAVARKTIEKVETITSSQGGTQH